MFVEKNDKEKQEGTQKSAEVRITPSWCGAWSLRATQGCSRTPQAPRTLFQ